MNRLILIRLLFVHAEILPVLSLPVLCGRVENIRVGEFGAGDSQLFVDPRWTSHFLVEENLMSVSFCTLFGLKKLRSPIRS